MTTTVTKVQTKWETKKTQETTANAFAAIYLSAHQALMQAGEKAHEEFSNLMVQHKIDHYKAVGVKTPMDLVRNMAETEHNLFGSDVEISGDENKATIKWNTCGMWNACKTLGKLTPEQETKMGESCSATSAKLAKEFGFKAEPNMTKETWEMTFSK